MASHNEIINMLQNNANYNDFQGSTAPASAGKLKRKSPAKKKPVGGKKRKPKAKPKVGGKRKPKKMKAGARTHPKTTNKRNRSSSTPYALEHYGTKKPTRMAEEAVHMGEEFAHMPVAYPPDILDVSKIPEAVVPMQAPEYEPESLVTGYGYLGGRYRLGGQYIGGEYIGGCMNCMKQGAMCHHCSAGMRLHKRRMKGGKMAEKDMLRQELDELKQEINFLRDEVHELKCYA